MSLNVDWLYDPEIHVIEKAASLPPGKRLQTAAESPNVLSIMAPDRTNHRILAAELWEKCENEEANDYSLEEAIEETSGGISPES